jgi:hypothetical protein
MGKSKKQSTSKTTQQRFRHNPITGQVDAIPGTKAGKKRMRTSLGDPLRTHDLRGPVGKKKKMQLGTNPESEDED